MNASPIPLSDDREPLPLAWDSLATEVPVFLLPALRPLPPEFPPLFELDFFAILIAPNAPAFATLNSLGHFRIRKRGAAPVRHAVLTH
jgi:hypothetical protein